MAKRKYFMTVKCRNEELDKKVTAQAEQVILNFPMPEGEKKQYSITITKTEDGFTVAIKDYSPVIPVIEYRQEDGIHTETEFDKGNNFEITIECDSHEDAAKIGELIHDNLKGLQDYVDSKILLNCDTDKVVLAFGAESDCYPYFLFKEEQ